MASKTFISLGALLLTPALISATSVEYYKSVFCDAQSPQFLIEKYTSPLSLSDDTLCHQTAPGTMGMKLQNNLDSSCIVLAYEDYSCTNPVGPLPASGKCVASTTARIGSWRTNCTTPETTPELRRRNNPRPRTIRDDNISTTTTTTENNVLTASSIASEISSALSLSLSDSVTLTVTSLPSAGAALSSAIDDGAGADVNYPLTSYLTDTATRNGTYPTPSMTVVATAAPTVTYIGARAGNGTALLHVGSSSGRTGAAWMALLSGLFVGAGWAMI